MGPNDAKGEADVVAWLKAAAIVAQKDPVAYGVLNKWAMACRHHITRKAISSISAITTGPQLASRPEDVGPAQENRCPAVWHERWRQQGAKFNYFKNYIESQLSCMYLNMLQAEPDGERLVAQAVAKVIVK